MWLKAGPGKPLLAVKAGFGSGRKKANRNHLSVESQFSQFSFVVESEPATIVLIPMYSYQYHTTD